MTEADRQQLRRKIDAATREKIAAPIEPRDDVIITEEGIEDETDEETLRRAALTWRDQGWGPMFTACSSCDKQAYSAGPTRATVICLPCYIAGPERKGKIMTASANNTKARTSLRAPFHAHVVEALPTVEVAEKAAYSRLVVGKKTVAYVNGDVKLRVEVIAPASAMPKSVGEFEERATLLVFSVKTAGDFKRVTTAIEQALPKAEPAASLADETAAEAAAAAKATEPVEVEPDPKPAKGKGRGRRAANAATS